MPAQVEYGSQGDDVHRLQQALTTAGYFVGGVDGHFGDKTAAAVAYFQSVCGLKIDGIAGRNTYDYLGIADVNDEAHLELPQEDAVHANGHYTVHVTGNAAHQGIRVVAWFRGAGGEFHSEATVALVAHQPVQADIPIPSEVTQAPGEWHTLVHAFNNADSIGEAAGSFHLAAQAHT